MAPGMFRTIASLVLAVAATIGCATPSHEVVVRGKLIWTNDRQTIGPCGTEETLWVRVLASNPYFHLTQRAKELSRSGDGDGLIATFKGELSRTLPSAGPSYEVDGVLIVHSIQSVEIGSCAGARAAQVNR
jgi:hypothetical protein